MYNRSTGARATGYLRAHPTLAHYAAAGTQITDDSLRTLASVPRLESAGFTNCDFITDEGVRALGALPRLRRVSVGSCMRVTGDWRAAMPAHVATSHDGSQANYIEGYRAETLIDYPDLPVPADVKIPLGTPPDDAGLRARMLCFGVRAAHVEDGLQLAVPPGEDPRWVGLMTRDAFAVPLRLELVVRPISELRLAFAAHNRFIALDDHGRIIDRTPWFMKSAAQRGEAVDPRGGFLDADWTRVTLVVEEQERRLYVNGELRHTWHEDYAGVRSRIGIGVQRSTITIRELTCT